ncbi:hypothetical protein NE237_000060 [Protea cynaroides]|uniref:Uncharacterized protein n=1 Tax=Protea cynaroides TaxID=273540 RepID=A0A9Q0GLX3_9MAGN|nr:hypothetical protein NE237_000060 [Protea cynaroides]
MAEGTRNRHVETAMEKISAQLVNLQQQMALLLPLQQQVEKLAAEIEAGKQNKQPSNAPYLAPDGEGVGDISSVSECDEEESEQELEANRNASADEFSNLEAQNNPAISLHALTGQNALKTLRLQGVTMSIQQHDFVMDFFVISLQGAEGKGDDHQPDAINMHQLKRLTRVGSIASCFALTVYAVTENVSPVLESEMLASPIQELMLRYKEGIKYRRILEPFRQNDGLRTEPVNVFAYEMVVMIYGIQKVRNINFRITLCQNTEEEEVVVVEKP